MNSSLRISFIGAGNVATRMAARLESVGCVIVDVCSRSGKPVADLRPQLADVVIVAVSDGAIAQVLDAVPSAADALWVHTAGSVGIDVFDPVKFSRHGVLYPLQTLLKDREVDWARVPLLVEGDPQVETVARLMSPSVAYLDSGQRCRLHAAAVMGCNMAMFLWSLCERITDAAGLPFQMLAPLLQMTAERAGQMSPAEAMTGPARRGDLTTLRKHIEALPPDIARTYAALSREMLQQFHPELTL